MRLMIHNVGLNWMLQCVVWLPVVQSPNDCLLFMMKEAYGWGGGGVQGGEPDMGWGRGGERKRDSKGVF